MADNQYQLEGNAPQLFERDNAQTLGSPLATQVLNHVELYAGDRVLDAACGTGIVTRVAAKRFPHVGKFVGIDRNAGMLEVARENTPTNVLVEWQQGDLSALPFPDDSFEAVLCQNGLQFVPDKSVVLREMHRVLVADGRLAFTVWSEVTPYAAALSAALARHISAEAAASNHAMFQLRDARTILDLVEGARFREITMNELVVIRPMPASAQGVVADTARTAFAHDVAAASEAARQALGQEVIAALQAYRDGDTLAIPHKSHLVQARAAKKRRVGSANPRPGGLGQAEAHREPAPNASRFTANDCYPEKREPRVSGQDPARTGRSILATELARLFPV